MKSYSPLDRFYLLVALLQHHSGPMEDGTVDATARELAGIYEEIMRRVDPSRDHVIEDDQLN